MSSLIVWHLIAFSVFWSFPVTTNTSKMSFKVETLGSGSYNLGEGPHWEPKSQSLFFVDAFVGRIHRWKSGTNETNGRTDEYDLKDLVTIVIPFKDRDYSVVVVVR